MLPPVAGDLTPDFALEDSVWEANAGAAGPALYVVLGQISLRISRCLFRANKSYKSGAAINFQGIQASLSIDSSIFDANEVQTAGSSRADVTVLLNTGGVGLGTGDIENGEFQAPIWRVDDGPVYGISFDLCQAALQHSRFAVSRGFPASWPSGPHAATCANISYTGPDSSYSHIIRLEEGVHTLWVGNLVEVSTQLSEGLSAVLQLNPSAAADGVRNECWLEPRVD